MNGEGVAKLDGKVVLIDGAIIGENIEISILSDKGNYAIGKVDNIVSKSPHRITPQCPYFFTCGGCSLQHMDYAEQLHFKKTLVQKTLKKIARQDFSVSDTVPCDHDFGYRNKLSFSVDKKICGFKHEKSDDIIDISYCPLADDQTNKVLEIFRDFMAVYVTDTSPVRNLVIRNIAHQILVGVVTREHIDLSVFYTRLSQEFSSIGLYEIINTRRDSVVISGKINHIAGIKNIKINNFGLTYFVDLIGFHQTNINIQDKLYKKVLEFVSCGDSIINGFSGQGLLSAILSTKAKNVVGIEINKNAHLSAEKLKRDNHISNLQNVLGDFDKEIKKYLHADTVVLDPSKKGCGQSVHEIIGVKNIIYISCNPIALAKDLKILLDDYTVEQIIPFDMFPQTNSVETLVKLKYKEKK